MASKYMFRDYRNLGRRALSTTNPAEVQTAIDAVSYALRSQEFVGKRARSLRGLRRALVQKLAPVG